MDGGAEPFVRVAGAVLVGDTLVIADAGTQRLHVHLADGRGLRRVGGKGQGPGEFVTLTWIQASGGRVFVYDRDPRRLSELSAGGELVESVTIEDAPGFAFPRALGVFADGSVLVRALPRDAGIGQEDGVHRSVHVLLRYGEDGSYRDSLTAYLETESYAEPWGAAGRISGPLFFGKKSAVAVGGTTFYVVENEDARIAVFDTAGNAMEAFRPDEAPPSRFVTDEDVGAVRQAGIDAGGSEEGLAVFDRMPFPSTFAPYGWHGIRELGMLRVDMDGSVWVLHAGRAGDAELKWTVFGPDGAVRARVTAPEPMEVLASTNGLIVVRHWDELDVETIQIQRLER